MVPAPRCPPGARGLLTLLLLLLPLPGVRGLCGTLPRLHHAVPCDTDRTEGFPIDTQVTYKCLDGFVKIPGKSDTVICLLTSEWSTIEEFCGLSCGAPPKLKFAALNKEDANKNYHPIGSSVSYICRPGYEKTERSPVINCLDNLTWSEAPEFCTGKSCGVPEGPKKGTAVKITNYLYGAQVNINCDEGFRLHGRKFIQCRPKGDRVEWSPFPTCEVITCSPPPNITNGKHNGRNLEKFDYNSSVTYKCDDNFSLSGEASIQCTTKDNINGVWNGPAPECKGLCGTLPRLHHAVPHDTDRTEGFPVDTQVTYKCLDGFVQSPGKSDTVVCLLNSEWSPIGEFCDRLCGTLQRLHHAVPHDTDRTEGFPIDTQVTYKCLDGFVQSTGKPDTVVCLSNSEWSPIGEFCDPITCSPPPVITNGKHNGSNLERFDYNSSVTYKCDDNFSLSGEASIQCTTKDNINGVWNGSAPECKVIITQDKPTTVLPTGAEVAASSSGSGTDRLIGISTVSTVCISTSIIGFIVGSVILLALIRLFQKKKSING